MMVYRFGRFSDAQIVAGAHAPQQAGGLRAFHNALRILMNIETDDLQFLTGEQRLEFFKNPHLFFIKADDPTADSLWALITSRQPERYRGIV